MPHRLVLAAIATASATTAAPQRTCHALSPTVTNGWCTLNCNAKPPNCPPTLCACSGAPTPAPAAPTPHPPAPTPAPAAPTPQPAPAPALSKRVVGYISNWGHYSNGFFKWTD